MHKRIWKKDIDFNKILKDWEETHKDVVEKMKRYKRWKKHKR